MTAIEGQQFGSWTLMKLDPTRKRALVTCQCGATGQVSTEALLSRENCRLRLQDDEAPGRAIEACRLREGERADGLKMTSAQAEHADLRERLSLSCLKRFGPRLAYLPRPDPSEGSASASRRGC